jgi:protein-tyrosine phosphatase
MKKEKKILEDCLDGHSRSGMDISMLLMLRYGMLKEEDMKGFSEELQEQLTTHLKMNL